MTEPTAAQRICLDAASLIEERGWTRGVHVRHGRVCLDHALALAWERLQVPARELDRAEVLVGRACGDHSFTAWNDAQRSRVPVLRALRTAGGQDG